MSTKHAHHPTPPEPWIWLQENDSSGAFDDCECHLDEIGPDGTPGAAFYMCAMHQQASTVLAALRKILNTLERLETKHKKAAFKRGYYEFSDIALTVAKIRILIAAATPTTTPPVRTATIPAA